MWHLAACWKPSPIVPKHCTRTYEWWWTHPSTCQLYHIIIIVSTSLIIRMIVYRYFGTLVVAGRQEECCWWRWWRWMLCCVGLPRLPKLPRLPRLTTLPRCRGTTSLCPNLVQNFSLFDFHPTIFFDFNSMHMPYLGISPPHHSSLRLWRWKCCAWQWRTTNKGWQSRRDRMLTMSMMKHTGTTPGQVRWYNVQNSELESIKI